MRARLLVSWPLALLLVVNLDASGDLRLLEAVKSKNKQALPALLKQGVDVNAPQPDGATALHWAAYWDDDEAADLLIRAGARVTAADDHGVTPLWLASLNGSAAMIERLVKAGADPNAALASGETPLMTAARTGNVASVKYLLAHGATVDAKQTSQGQTALMWAVAQRHPDVVQALIDGGANLHNRSNSWDEVHTSGLYRDESHFHDFKQGGFTPLLFAARSGDIASAKILLAAGANVNDTTAAGTSTLVVAIHSGHVGLANLLIDNGADVNAMDGGYSPLHIAVRSGARELVQTLLTRGANVKAVVTKATSTRPGVGIHYSFIGTTPFWIAARLADVEMMRLLADHGADTSFVAPGGRTILIAPVTPHGLPGFRASEERSLAAVKAALDYGADVNAIDDRDGTALHGAARLGFNTVVQFLVEKGAKLDVENREGQTPLGMTLPYIAEFSSTPQPENKKTGDLLRKLGATE